MECSRKWFLRRQYLSRPEESEEESPADLREKNPDKENRKCKRSESMLVLSEKQQEDH